MQRHRSTRAALPRPDAGFAAKSLRPVLDELSIALVLLDAGGEILAGNREAGRLFGGHRLPTLHTHPQIRRIIAERQETAMLLRHPSLGTASRIRFVPTGDLLLIEAFDVTDHQRLESELEAVRETSQILEAEIEELMCASELARTRTDAAAAKSDEQRAIVEQLFASNVDLLAWNRRLLARIAELEGSEASEASPAEPKLPEPRHATGEA